MNLKARMSGMLEWRSGRTDRLLQGAVVIVLLGLIQGCAGVDSSTIRPAPASASAPVSVAPSTAPTIAPATPAPSPALLGVADIGRPLESGRYRVAAPFAVPLSITIPQEWTLKSLVEGDVSFTGPGDGAPWVVIELVDNVFADPCDSAGGPIDPPISPTVDGIVAALTTMVGFQIGPVSEVVVGTRAGKAFDLTNDVDTATADCDGGPMLPLWTYRGGGQSATNGGLLERIWVVDVDGTTVVVDRGGTNVDAVATSLEFGTP